MCTQWGATLCRAITIVLLPIVCRSGDRIVGQGQEGGGGSSHSYYYLCRIGGLWRGHGACTWGR